MKNTIKSVFVALVVLATITTTYAVTCYAWIYQQQCAAPGQCFSSCTPQGCSQSTCLIATGYGYETGQYNVNVYPNGSMPTRSWSGTTYNACYVSGCMVYNNCTQQYESPPAWCSCTFAVKAYTGSPTGCP